MLEPPDYADEEWIDDAEPDDASEADLLTCPACRGAVHEDTQQCPHCGDWITPIDARGQRRRMIWIVAALLVIASFLLAAVM